MQPKISIIIPVYKTEPFLRKCLDSVVNQTLEEIEIICVNDGSPDNSLSILSEYASKDNRIIVIDQTNDGVSVARNTGMAAAKGQYIGFVDSDDWIEPETYAKALQYMADDVDLVCWGVNLEGAAKTKKKMQKLFDMSLAGKILADSSNKFSLPTTICDKLFRKELIKKNHIYFPKHLRYEDTCFLWKYMLHVSYFHCIAHKYYHYMLHQESFTNTISHQENHKYLPDRLHTLYEVYLHYDKFDATAFCSEFFARRFYRYFRKIYQKIPSENKNDLLKQAVDIAEKMNIKGSEYHRQLFFLRNGEFNKMEVVIREQPLLLNRLWRHIKSWIYFRKCPRNKTPLALMLKVQNLDQLIKKDK